MTALNAPENFNWPLAYEAEQLLRGFVDAFLARNGFARRLAGRMRVASAGYATPSQVHVS